MANEKVISTIGVSDEDVAHLRLLMRKSVDDLGQPWRWGVDTRADLLVVDPSNFAGQMARSRAKVTGMRVAIICNAGEPSDGDPALVRPLKSANIVEVLNQASSGSAGMSTEVAPVENLFLGNNRDAGFNAGASDGSYLDDKTEQGPAGDGVAPGLEELIRDNPLADPYLNLLPASLDDSTGIERTGEQTRRSELRAEREREVLGVPLAQPSPSRPPVRAADGTDRSAHRLREYLEGNLIGGPVQIAWRGAGVLTLDPKHEVYHSAQSLRELEVYCRESPRRSDWRRLTSTELTEIRETQPAQPYHKLVWLDVLLHSDGKLATNLDPGGTYELLRWLEIARDYPNYARISAAMMQPARLHEIAASCGSSMGDVFAVVNAYDAIDCLKKTPRPSRHAEPEEGKTRPSLLDRLRRPFGKS